MPEVPEGEIPEGGVTFRDLALARKGQGPLAPAWWALRRQGRLARTELVRSALVRLWAGAVREAGPPPGPVALGGVGSLGRSELGPMSDLDLVVVYEGRSWSADHRKRFAQALWYEIWDAGFDLDQSFRSLAECRRVASSDLPAATGLLSLRHLAGDEGLAGRAASAVLGDWRAAARRRLTDLSSSVARRESAFGHLAYRLEPDLKEARGGTRDTVTLDAVVASWLAERPRRELGFDEAREYLLDVRDAVHLAAHRGTSLLLMADQDSAARALDPYLTADQLLTNLARAGRTVAYALDTTIRRATGNLPGSHTSPAVIVRGRRQGPRLAPLAQGLAEFNGEIVLGAGPAPEEDPVLPLRAARVAAQTGLAFEPLTVLSLRRCPPLPDPWPLAARQELAAFLAEGLPIIATWEALDQAGLIVRLWPQWAPVRNLIQRNPLHRYTVDRHQVEAAARLAGLDLGTAPPDLVAVATLFHDLGKRPGERDHAGLGALLARPLAAHLGYAAEEVDFIVTLIRHHLTLAELATSCDPAASATQEHLASAVGHRLDLLDGLAALTEADARATGPKAWTKLRASLIRQLVAATRARLAQVQGLAQGPPL